MDEFEILVDHLVENGMNKDIVWINDEEDVLWLDNDCCIIEQYDENENLDLNVSFRNFFVSMYCSSYYQSAITK